MSIRTLCAASLGLAGVVTPSIAFAQSTVEPFTDYTRYDGAGRVVGTISPDPDGAGASPHLATRTEYDARGLVVKVESGRLTSYQDESVLPADWGTPADDADPFTVDQMVQTGYDQFRRKVWDKVTGSDGIAVGLTQYSYDNLGRLKCTAVRMNPAIYPQIEAGAIAGTLDACSPETEGGHGPDRITKTIYDAAGQVLQVRVGVDSPVDPATGESVEAAQVTYSYTDNGQIEYLIDANGNRTTYEYDGFDRLHKWFFPSKAGASAYDDTTPGSALSSASTSSTTDFEEYSYDANGNRTALRKRDGSVITYAYDALNRMTSKALPTIGSGARPELPWRFRRDVHYTYDLRGLQTAVQFDITSGQGILTQYDGFGRITQTTNTLDAKNYVIGSAYDANGNRTSVTHPDNATFGYVYDGLDRADHIKDPSGAWIINPSYDDQGRMNSIYRNGNAIDTLYRYDTVGRLNRLDFLDVVASAQVRWDYTRNPAGQIATEARDNDQYAWLVENTFERNYTTNGLNQYESAGTVDFCYDDNGNLTADGTYVYLYDFENRLVQMRSQVNTDCANLAYTGTWKAEFTYDPLGRLNMVNQGGNATRYVHDGDALIAEYRNSDNALLRRYVHGTNAEADDPLVWYEGAGTARSDRRYLYADPRGSIVLTADADGNTIAINAYDEYGIPTTSNNGFDITTRGRFRYTGQVWLPELGMYYYKARIYSPTLGRFMQTDPIGYEDQFNLYAYVANDPINGVDPSGEKELEVEGGVSLGGSGVKISGSIDFENGEVSLDVEVRAGIGPEGSVTAKASLNESGEAKGTRAEASYEGNVKAEVSGQAGPLEAGAEHTRSFGGRHVSTDQPTVETQSGTTETSTHAGIEPSIGAEVSAGVSVGVDFKFGGTVSLKEGWRKFKKLFE